MKRPGENFAKKWSEQKMTEKEVVDWGVKEKKKSYDTFSDFEVLAFSEMGHHSPHYESGVTPLEALKLTQEGPKNF